MPVKEGKNLSIGEKIRRLRLSKMMTQADLAGDQVTRNMLCSIERGAALPSLPTAIYLAERLNVPVGYLLSEKSEENLSYRKMIAMPEVRRALQAGDAAGCLSILHNAFGGECDDEIALIRAECEYRVAREALDNGHLRVAAARLDRSLSAGEKTLYETGFLRARAAVCFRYLTELTPTLASDILEEGEISAAREEGDDFCAYFLATEAFHSADDRMFNTLSARLSGTLYAQKLSAMTKMKNGDFASARAVFEKLLSDESLCAGVLMYEIFKDLEICCRGMDDYKSAYEYSASAIGLMEHMLEGSES